MSAPQQVFEVFWRFLLLGCVSFGGPAAHVGYFQRAFVQQRGWLTQDQFASALALSQFLPGPGSSQLGFTIGLHRAGSLGGWAAFVGFTLPSFLLMFGLATYAGIGHQNALFSAVVIGLKWLAVVVVADAIYTMFLSFCKTLSTRGIMVASALLIVFIPGIWTQIFVIVLAAICGWTLLSPAHSNAPTDKMPTDDVAKTHTPIKHLLNAKQRCWLLAFAVCLMLSFIGAHSTNGFTDALAYFQAGSLVFGGGHVVLPLLKELVDVSAEQFLTGYAAAQGVPGPMFTFATFLGGISSGSVTGALVATIAIFLPGFMLVMAFWRTWSSLSHRPVLQGVSAGINASVVGLLVAAFYQPVWSSAVHSVVDVLVIAAGVLCLRVCKLHVVFVLAFIVSCALVSRVLLGA